MNLKGDYSLIGWSSSVDGHKYSNNEKITINQDITLTARWIKQSDICKSYNYGSTIEKNETYGYITYNVPLTGTYNIQLWEHLAEIEVRIMVEMEHIHRKY